MSGAPPLLTIITGTRNRPKLLADMVNSVLENTQHPFELLIGDCSDGELFSCDDPRVRVLPEPVPLGSVRGYNKLFRAAKGNFVVYLNDDLVVLPGWSTAVLDVFDRHPEVDLAILPLIEPKGPDPFILLYNQIPIAQMGVLRREAGEALGWFNERYHFYAPDIDLTMRVVDAGRRFAPVFGKVLVHFKVEDDMRESNQDQFNADNTHMQRVWKRRFWQIARKYRADSFRYFEGLETERSKDYGLPVLMIPDSEDARPKHPSAPHRVRNWPGILNWLGL